MNEPNETSIQKMGLQYGVISGILFVIFVLVLYIMGGDYLFRTSLQFLGHLIPIVFMIYTVQQYRKQHGNFVTFRSAFGGAFAVSAVSFLFLVLFSAVLYAFIDPELVSRQKQYLIEQTIEWLQWSNMPEEQIDAQIDKMKEEDYSPTFKNSALGYAGGLLFSAIYAAIIALVFWLISRKYEPKPSFDYTPTDPTVLDQNP